VAEHDFGSLGTPQGPPVAVDCPLRDALRSIFLWFVVLALLLRKPNRSRQAWTLLLALGAVFLILHVAESYINAHIIFYLHRHMCSLVCEMLRALAGALAVLLAMSDLITPRRRPFRFILAFLILFAAGAAAILLNAPVVANGNLWAAVFGFFLLVFLIGHAMVHTLLRWLTGPRQLAWSVGISLLLGVAPTVAFAITGSILNRSVHLQSVIISFRFAVMVSQVILTPYFVLFWFLLLALLVPLYRRRLAQSFGYPTDA